jgi:hypothetical protein
VEEFLHHEDPLVKLMVWYDGIADPEHALKQLQPVVGLAMRPMYIL